MGCEYRAERVDYVLFTIGFRLGQPISDLIRARIPPSPKGLISVSASKIRPMVPERNMGPEPQGSDKACLPEGVVAFAGGVGGLFTDYLC